VLGGLSANVECSGDLVIRSDGKINGSLQCRQLRVEKGARVEFLADVTAGSAIIEGEVRGRLACSGPVILEKGARLHGLVRCSELIVKSRAKHTGTLELTNALP
jgi:cytoskeletal protein CcmA (bactofilin family)